MAAIFSLPFRIGTNGQAASVDQYSDAGVAQQIAVLILTQKGEHELAPNYGIADPLWTPGVDVAEINAQLAIYGPPAVVSTISADYPTDRTERLLLEFTS